MLVGEPFPWEDETWVFLPSETSPSLAQAGPGRHAPAFELVGVKNLLWNPAFRAFLLEQARHLPLVVTSFALFLFGNCGFPPRTALAPAFQLDKKALQVQHLAATLHTAPIKAQVAVPKSLPATFSTMAPNTTPTSTVTQVESATVRAPSKGRENPARVHSGSPLSGSRISRFFLPDAKAPAKRNEE